MLRRRIKLYFAHMDYQIAGDMMARPSRYWSTIISLMIILAIRWRYLALLGVSKCAMSRYLKAFQVTIFSTIPLKVTWFFQGDAECASPPHSCTKLRCFLNSSPVTLHEKCMIDDLLNAEDTLGWVACRLSFSEWYIDAFWLSHSVIIAYSHDALSFSRHRYILFHERDYRLATIENEQPPIASKLWVIMIEEYKPWAGEYQPSPQPPYHYGCRLQWLYRYLPVMPRYIII